MWIEMFFIKFEGKIENIRGNAALPKNLMKNIEIHIFFSFVKKNRELPTSGNCFFK